MSAYKAVIFDLDGTLLDTLEDLSDSVNDALRVLGYPLRSIEEIRVRVGDGVLALLEKCLPAEAAAQEKILMRSVHEMGESYSRRWNQKTRPYPDIPKVLDTLMLKRIPMGILSNKPHPFTVEMSAYFLNKWDFVFIAGGREHLPLKPNPAAAYLALEAFQKIDSSLSASDILFVGDGDTDIKTAQAAGMDPLAALWGFRSREQLKAVGAEMFIENPLEILPYFS